ncbi:MAG: PH domain-containing protein [Streptosporangiales bacterium]|nr:PH domain-containing protein [Streptosporangiales bacterium]
MRAPAHTVSRRAVYQWVVEGFVQFAILLAIGLLITWWNPDFLPDAASRWRWILPIALGLFGLLFVVVEPVWRYRVHRWEVTAGVVFTRAGWLSREWRVVPVSRIQSVDTQRGVLQRMFGLATLVVQTASHAGSSQIVGLPADVAVRLSFDLAQQANLLEDDAT